MDKTSVVLSGLATLLALAAGGAMALQPAVNAKLASHCSHPLQASIISFGTGLVALLMLGLVLQVGLPSLGRLQSLPPWAWIGGLLGTYMVTVSLLVAPTLGATRWIALVLTGQITLSLVLDHFGWVGYSQHPLTWQRMLGLLCLAAGVVIVMKK
jgi:transporter family-2 protein